MKERENEKGTERGAREERGRERYTDEGEIGGETEREKSRIIYTEEGDRGGDKERKRERGGEKGKERGKDGLESKLNL